MLRSSKVVRTDVVVAPYILGASDNMFVTKLFAEFLRTRMNSVLQELAHILLCVACL